MVTLPIWPMSLRKSFWTVGRPSFKMPFTKSMLQLQSGEFGMVSLDRQPPDRVVAFAADAARALRARRSPPSVLSTSNVQGSRTGLRSCRFERWRLWLPYNQGELSRILERETGFVDSSREFGDRPTPVRTPRDRPHPGTAAGTSLLPRKRDQSA